MEFWTIDLAVVSEVSRQDASISSPPSGVTGATVLNGMRAGLPIVIGCFPIAFSFGVVATDLGFSAIEAVFLSLTIYSGASQFMALTLLSGGTAAVVSVITLLAMNLRHVLYGPALLDRAGETGSRHAWAWAFGLTDEVFATTIVQLSGPNRGRRWNEWWMYGIGAVAYLSWISGTAVGAVAGAGALGKWPAVDAALGFMLPALFLALLLAILGGRQIPSVTTAAIVCFVVTSMSNTTAGILAGMVAGTIAGLVSVPRRPDAVTPSEAP